MVEIPFGTVNGDVFAHDFVNLFDTIQHNGKGIIMLTTTGAKNMEARPSFELATSLNPVAKIARTLRLVTRAQGFGHSLKVAFGPTLNDLGLWRMSGEDRELVFWERQIIGIG